MKVLSTNRSKLLMKSLFVKGFSTNAEPLREHKGVSSDAHVPNMILKIKLHILGYGYSAEKEW